VRLLLRGRREQRGEVIDGSHVAVADEVLHLARVRRVEELEALARMQRVERRHPDIGGDDRFLAVALTEGDNELGTDLAERSSDEDSSHREVKIPRF
jgi:hypothetical protein